MVMRMLPRERYSGTDMGMAAGVTSSGVMLKRGEKSHVGEGGVGK